MSDLGSRPGNMPAGLSTIPVEILRMVISNVKYTDLLPLRLVCRAFEQSVMEIGRHHFSYIRAEFTRQSLDQVLKFTDLPSFQTFAEGLSVTTPIYGEQFASLLEPGWERDKFGYFINPENIDEIRILKSISSKLPNCTTFDLLYLIDVFKPNHWTKVSLQKLIPSVLTICAAMKAHVKGLMMEYGVHIGYPVCINATRSVQHWDESTPTLDAICDHLEALEIHLKDDMSTSDLRWIETFILKCSMLEKLSLKHGLITFPYPSLGGPSHASVNDTVTPEMVPPVQVLALCGMDFTREELMRFVDRFKDTIRSIDFCNVIMIGGQGWPLFLEWLWENLPSLEKFGFQGLFHDDDLLEEEEVICFDSIFNDPGLHFKALKGALWQSYADLSNGVLALDLSGKFNDVETDEFWADFDRGIYKLDSKPRKNERVYTAAFKGSNSGAREALRLLALAAAPQDLQDFDYTFHTKPPSIGW